MLAQLYASSRLYINFFQPSFKLKSKIRDVRTREEGVSRTGDAM